MKATEIAHFLGMSLHGEDLIVNGASSLDDLRPNTLVFAKNFSEELCSKINDSQVFLIACKEYSGRIKPAHILVDNPRLSYLRAVRQFFSNPEAAPGIHSSACIEDGAIIGKNVSIGPFCRIGPEVLIGDHTIIGSSVSIFGPVKIGQQCQIKSGAVIGNQGFGFEYNEEGVLEHFPHIGRIEIGDHVQIGSNTCIDRATLGVTSIEEGTKIDNFVQIAHNVHIEKNVMLLAGALIGGGVHIGHNSWISSHSIIKQQIKIGNHVMVGMASIVYKDVPNNKIAMGNPAKVFDSGFDGNPQASLKY